MPIAHSRLEARRRELARSHGALNLVPLVDILTAIVFFSLLSAVTNRAALASFDLATPPAVSDASGTSSAPPSRPDIVVRVDRGAFMVRYADQESVVHRRNAHDDASFAQLRDRLLQATQELGRAAVITVVPSDDVAYDDVVRVLEHVHQVKPAAVALGSRARVPPN